MIIIINISSKNYRSLHNFVIKFLNKNYISQFKIFVKEIKLINPTKSTLYSVLKSPHVNKIAQEQFMYKIYNIQLKIFLFQPNLLLRFLKFVKNRLVSDIKINYKIVLNKSLYKQNLTVLFNTNRLYFYNKKEKNFLLKNFLKFNSIHGEFLLKNKSLGSSVG